MISVTTELRRFSFGVDFGFIAASRTTAKGSPLGFFTTMSRATSSKSSPALKRRVILLRSAAVTAPGPSAGTSKTSPPQLESFGSVKRPPFT